MAQIPTGQKTIAQINTEVSSVNSNSLRTLSQNANSYTGGNSAVVTNNIPSSPHSMNEFSGYTHGPQSHTVGWTRNGPSGKIGQYYTSNETGTSVPFGSYNWDSWTHRSYGTTNLTIYWSGGRNDSWTSFQVGSSTFNRAFATSTSTTTHFFSGLSTQQASDLQTYTTGYFIYGP